MTNSNVSPLVRILISALTLHSSSHNAKTKAELMQEFVEEFYANCDKLEINPVEELVEFIGFASKLAMYYEYEPLTTPSQNLSDFVEFMAIWIRQEADESTIFYSSDLDEAFGTRISIEHYDTEIEE